MRIDYHFPDKETGENGLIRTEPPAHTRPIPRKGEVIHGPDDSGPWIVMSVIYFHDRGFFFAPDVRVVLGNVS